MLLPARGQVPEINNVPVAIAPVLAVMLERGQPPAIGRHGEEVHRRPVLETMAQLSGPRIADLDHLLEVGGDQAILAGERDGAYGGTGRGPGA